VSDAVAALSPLAGHVFAAMPEVALRERPLGSFVQVAAWPGVAVDDLLRAADLGDGDGDILDGGPGARLVAGAAPDLFRRLDAAVPAERGAVTDLSHGRVLLELSGPRSAWVLSKGVQMDLHRRAFPVGRSALTTFGAVGLLLHRRGAELWDLYTYGGLARSLVEALELAGRADMPG
jgi:sarcosine oxidase subunit gamma